MEPPYGSADEELTAAKCRLILRAELPVGCRGSALGRGRVSRPHHPFPRHTAATESCVHRLDLTFDLSKCACRKQAHVVWRLEEVHGPPARPRLASNRWRARGMIVSQRAACGGRLRLARKARTSCREAVSHGESRPCGLTRTEPFSRSSRTLLLVPNPGLHAHERLGCYRVSLEHMSCNDDVLR